MIAIESAVRARTIGFIVAVALSGVLATRVSARAPQSAASHADAAGTFKDRCEVCHGADGSGTTSGKGLQITDLRSDKVQQQPDSALSQAILEGKNNMPAFGSSLDGCSSPKRCALHNK